MATKIITLSLPEELVRQLDQAAQEEFASRSDLIRQSIVEHLRVVHDYRTRLAAAALNTNTITEDEIYKLLRWKHSRRLMRAIMNQRI